jgi:hypothetical protein
MLQIKSIDLPIMTGIISRHATLAEWKIEIANYWVKQYYEYLTKKICPKLKDIHPSNIRIWKLNNNCKIPEYLSMIKSSKMRSDGTLTIDNHQKSK